MSTVERITRLSVADYLDRERDSAVRHEYIDGELYAMVGASRAHNLIAGNLFAVLHEHLRGSPCRVFMSDMKVRIDEVNRFYYPDLMVCCAPLADEPDEYFETRPAVVVEILSASTTARDRWEKRLAYQRLESLKEYVLVGQDTRRVEIFRRTAEGWEREICTGVDCVRLDAIDCELPLTAIYQAVPGVAE